MIADDIQIERRSGLRSTRGGGEVRITFPPGPLEDGTLEGCHLGFFHNGFLMTEEHYEALKERLWAIHEGVDDE
jgi:hypothetical protein